MAAQLLQDADTNGMSFVIGGTNRKITARKIPEIAGMSHGIGGKTRECTAVCPLLLEVKHAVSIAVFPLCPKLLGVKQQLQQPVCPSELEVIPTAAVPVRRDCRPRKPS